MYLTRLSGCVTAEELALVVVSMVESGTGINKEMMVKERFIKLLLPLAPGITSGGLSIISVPVSMALGEKS